MKCLSAVLVLIALGVSAQAAVLDLREAEVVEGPGINPKTVTFLVEEVARRSGVTWESSAEARGAVSILLTHAPDAGLAPEGYEISIQRDGAAPQVRVEGADARGVLFGAGHLIRMLSFGAGAVSLDESFHVRTAPAYAIRGHQLGYRDTANTYDAWDLATFEQYFRDLIIFGTNAVELIPASRPGPRDSQVMPVDPWTMNQDLSALLGSYGLDVWLWLAVQEDLAQPEQADAAAARYKRLFESMEHLTAVFVPGGDGGHHHPRDLMPWLPRLHEALVAAHPEATVWVSHQTWDREGLDYFFDYLEQEQPEWLAGVVHGPWTRVSIPETRRRTPAQYPIRRYDDISHNVRCQYPVQDWDPAFAITLGRESVNPRPHQMSNAHNLYAEDTAGFVAYSDGAHDDFNKVLWSALGWDPARRPEDIAAEYARVFFGSNEAERGAQALLGLEANWRGPVEDNTHIDGTLSLWRGLDAAWSGDAPNWRLQMYLKRALYDHLVQQRYLTERQQELDALESLRETQDIPAAIARAREILDEANTSPAAAKIAEEITRLGHALRESIGYQLSIHPPFHASNAERGAVLDYLDEPLNNRRWLEVQFQAILAEQSTATQRQMIDTLLTWENPGEGSYYDNFGKPGQQPHLVRQRPWEEDPSGFDAPRNDYGQPRDRTTLALDDNRLSWYALAETLYGTPLQARYTGLDPNARYRLRITYAGRYNPTMSLFANGTHEIHGLLQQPRPIAQREYELPQTLTSGGTLELEWRLHDGRGCQVAEIWLLKD